MIKDIETKKDINKQWATIKKLCSFSHRQYQISEMCINETRSLESYNLPFVLSFSVLDQVLEILMVEGNFNCSKNHRHGLDCRMKSSKGKLEWKNFCLALIGKEHRNCLAHEGILLNKKECLKYINTIEEELNNWKIIDH